MNERHTPGPWVWAKDGLSYSLVQAVGPRACVLSVGDNPREEWPAHQVLKVRYDAPGGSLMVPFDPAHPDARLIAAAPLLLQEAEPAQKVMQYAAASFHARRKELSSHEGDLMLKLAWQAGRLMGACLRATEGGER